MPACRMLHSCHLSSNDLKGDELHDYSENVEFEFTQPHRYRHLKNNDQQKYVDKATE